jgi:hypothetical protein
VPLRRLSDGKGPDGLVPLGSMSKWVRLEELNQEIQVKVSIRRRKAEITTPYLQGVRVGMFLAYENRRICIDRVEVLGLDQQICLKCTEAGNLT